MGTAGPCHTQGPSLRAAGAPCPAHGRGTRGAGGSPAKAPGGHQSGVSQPGQPAAVTQRREGKFRLTPALRSPPTGFLAPFGSCNSPAASWGPPGATGPPPAGTGSPTAGAGSCGQPQLSLLLMRTATATAACTWGLARALSPARGDTGSPAGRMELRGCSAGCRLWGAPPCKHRDGSWGRGEAAPRGGCDRHPLHPLPTWGWWLWHRSASGASKVAVGGFPRSKG